MQSESAPPASHPRNTNAERLPQEVFTLIAAYLSKNELAICTRVCKEWYDCFSPSLWETVDIDLLETHFLFAASVKEGSLTRNGGYIKKFSTKWYSNVNILESHGHSCINLVDLEVHSYDDPPMITSPTQIGGFGVVELRQPAGMFGPRPSNLGSSIGDTTLSETQVAPSSDTAHSSRIDNIPVGQYHYLTGVANVAHVAHVSPTIPNSPTASSDQVSAANNFSETSTANLPEATGANSVSGGTSLGSFAGIQVGNDNDAPESTLEEAPTSFAGQASTLESTSIGSFGAGSGPSRPSIPFGGQSWFGSGKGARPSPTDIDSTNLVQLLKRNLKLRKLGMHGRMFHCKDPNHVIRILQAIPKSVKSLVIEKIDPFPLPVDFDEHEAIRIRFEDEGDRNPDSKEETLLDITQIEFQGVMPDDKVLIPLLKRCTILEKLVFNRALGSGISQEFSSALRENCPRLNEFRLPKELYGDTFNTDEGLSRLIDASASGWKCISMPYLRDFGPLSKEALLKHAPSLEVLDLEGCYGPGSSTIQSLLSSAPNLRRLQVLQGKAYIRGTKIELDAQDIVRSRWICDKLEVLKIKIGGIPRPDLRTRTNKRPLTGPFHEGTMEHDDLIQRKVYSQLGAMTHLKELILGIDDRTYQSDCTIWVDEPEEGEYRDWSYPQYYRQYECLPFTLESGMDRLRNLKSLERLHLRGMSVGFNGEAEQEWVKLNWPALKISYGDWNFHDRAYWGSDLEYSE
ncbi:hypothetical protein BGX27_003501 [Mortierella sp. AM989]|nr:hypothetical protein BGX27_003501 [Mortierella sp. AM989]